MQQTLYLWYQSICLFISRCVQLVFGNNSQTYAAVVNAAMVMVQLGGVVAADVETLAIFHYCSRKPMLLLLQIARLAAIQGSVQQL